MCREIERGSVCREKERHKVCKEIDRVIFERFIQLGKHVKIAINISITGAFG